MSADKKSINIFYADDSPSDRLLFKIALEEIAVTAELKMASDGKKAMQILNDSDGYAPDIIFLDLKMPFKDGNECLKEIRKIKKFTLTPVIIFSTSCEIRDIKRAYKNNANLYVQKPYDLDRQLKIMKEIFSLNWKKHPPHPVKEEFVFKI